MAYLLALLGILSAIGVWSWRLRMAKRGFDQVSDLAKTAINAPRRMAFRYKAGKNGLGLIRDPREAAAIMLTEVARARGGPLTERQVETIEAEIAQTFEFTKDDAEALAAHAAWVTNSAPPPLETMQRLSRIIMTSDQIGPKEIVDLDAMLVSVSEAEGMPTRDQLTLLQLFRDQAGLRA